MSGNLLRLDHSVATAIVNCGRGARCDTGLPTTPATSANLQHGLEAVFGIVAVVAVVVVVIGGLQFILAQGDPQGVARARMTIIYAVVGLAVAISAEAIVAFVLGRL
jgi:Type IV secretion system pilin